MKRKLAAVLAAILTMNYLAGSPMVAYAYVGDYRSLNEISENESEMSLDEIDELEDETDNPEGLFCEDVELVSEDDASNDVDGENSLTSDSVVSDNEAILNDDSEILTETLISDEENLEDGVEDQAGIETEIEDDEITVALDDELDEDSSDSDDEAGNEVSQIDVEYRVNTKWDNKAVVQVIITNNTDDTVHNWGLRFNCNDTFINVYNAEVVKEDDEYLLKSRDYNQDIKPGQSIYLGYTQIFDDEIDVPSDFEIVSVEKITDGSDISALLTINNTWDNYAEAEIILTNNRDTVIKDWKCSFNANFEITSIWDAEIISCSDNSYTIKNADHQQNIYPAESISVGMIIKTDDEPAISNFKIYEIVNNSVSNNSVSDNTVSDNSVSDNTVSENTVSENTVSDNSVSDNTVSDNDIDDVLVLMVDAIKLISEGAGEYISENGYEYDEMEGVSTYIMETYPELVESVAVSSGNTLTINLLSGIFFTYQVSDSSEPLNMSRGGMLAQDSITSFVNETEDIADAEVHLRGIPTGSSDVLVWAPYDDAWGEYDETDIVSAIMEDADVSQYLTIISNEDADIESLKDLGDYGLIVFATHGSEGKWLVTGEAMEANDDYLEDVLAGRMCISSMYDIETGTCDYKWQVSADWLDENVGELADCIVLNNSCESSFNTDICDVMLSKGAKTYFGYNGNVTNQYILFETSDILSQLIYDGTATEDAFTITLDAYFGGGSLEIYGYGNVVMPYGEYSLDEVALSDNSMDYISLDMWEYGATAISALEEDISAYSCSTSVIINNSFEDEDEGWNITETSLDADNGAKFLSWFYDIEPTDGDRMLALIRQDNSQITYVEQNVVVPENAKYLLFDCNFLDAYDESMIVDGIVNVSYENGLGAYAGRNSVWVENNIKTNTRILQNNGLELGGLITKMPGASVCGIDNVWQSGWNTRCIDVAAEAGQEIIIKFYIYGYDNENRASMAFIDNIRFDSEETYIVPMTNGSFEAGLSGWYNYNRSYYDKGYGAIAISELGSITPTNGNNMLVLDGKIRLCQTIYIPEGAKELHFDYNILSATDSENEEYNEYKKGHNGMLLLTDIDQYTVWDAWNDSELGSLNAAMTESTGTLLVSSLITDELYPVPDVSIAENSKTVMSGWLDGSIDVTKYEGQYVTLKLSLSYMYEGMELALLDNFHFEYDENLELTNPSFEDGDAGWNIGYTDDIDVIPEYYVISEFMGIKPIDGSYMFALDTKATYYGEEYISQTFMVPVDTKYMYFDYNIIEEYDEEKLESGELLVGNTISVRYSDDNDQTVNLWEKCNDVAMGTKGEMPNPNDNLIPLDNSYIEEDVINPSVIAWSSGWKVGAIDVSDIAGKTVTISFNMGNEHYADGVIVGRLLLDNIRFDISDSLEDIEVSYIGISAEHSPEEIRKQEVDVYGKSYVYFSSIYNDEVELKGEEYEQILQRIVGAQYQADYARIKIMYQYGYANAYQQIGMYEVSTEQDFLNYWEDMEANELTDVIDEVVILMHGVYYALMIDAEKGENLTTSPDGRVGSDENSLKISDLPRRNIGIIRINACNTGLIDAINACGYIDNERYVYNYNEIKKDNFFILNGNVAQAFLNAQNVGEVYAWDGNMTPQGKIHQEDGLSSDGSQGGFNTAMKNFDVLGRWCQEIGRPYVESSGEMTPMPIGCVHYRNADEKQYCEYTYTYNGDIHYVYIDLNNDDNYCDTTDITEWNQFINL